MIDNAHLLEIEEKVQRTLSAEESGLLLADLRRLRYRPIKELLQSFPEYVCSLAERNEKAVHPFEIEGGEILVDPLQYYDFIQSLGHVFRNSIVHGLETMEERLEIGKDEIGTIRCTITENEASLNLVIADDGRGIDLARIREIAVRRGICTSAEANSMREEEWVQFIFADNFSVSNNVNELAGRGVGLSAVRAELEKISGSVNVHTVPGQGTQFRFFLPLPKPEEIHSGTIQHMAQALLDATKVCLQSAGLKITRIAYMEGEEDGKLTLRKASNFLNVKGILNGKIILSADQEVVECLGEKQYDLKTADGTFDKKLENILLQYTRKIYSQAVNEKLDWAGKVTAETLVSILAEDASVKYPQVETPTWIFYTNLGSINLSLLY